jgi:glycosyltransferase involved in cell wall biosynthesis
VLSVTPAVFGDNGIFGGGERYVHSVAEALSHAGAGKIKPTILGFTDKSPCEYRDGSVRIILAKTDNFAQNRLDWYGRQIWDVVRDFDLIHVHQPFTRCGEVALCAAASLGKAIVATDLGGGLPPADPANHPISFADRIIAISAFSSRLLGERASVAIRVVIGPVGDKYAEPPIVSNKKIGALYVGRIMPHKGIDRLIRAAPSDLSVTIAGKGYDSEYEAYLRSLAKGKAVQFIDNPNDDDLLRLYAGAAVHVAPSVVLDYRGRYHPNAELMGITTMEALASGTPVAVANTCSLPELIADADVGECFSNENELSDILARVHSGSWIAQYAPAKCRAFAVGNYSLDLVGRKIADVYNEALCARSAA